MKMFIALLTFLSMSLALAATPGEKAAQNLFSAWKSKQRNLALQYATPSVVNKLFNTMTTNGVSAMGCYKEYQNRKEKTVCQYYYEGGSFDFVVGLYGRAYKVEKVITRVD